MEKITKKQIKKHLKRWKEAHAKIEGILKEQYERDTDDINSALWPNTDIKSENALRLIVNCSKSMTHKAEKYLLENN